MKLIGLMKLKDQFHQNITSHIYLGSFKNALCLSILNKLVFKNHIGGIVPWLNRYIFQRHNDITINQSTDGNIETIYHHPKRKPTWLPILTILFPWIQY